MLVAAQDLAAMDMERGFEHWWDDADDEVVDRQLSVQGTIPPWLRGRLLRNGPGRWRAPDGSRTYLHAFDGLAKLVRGGGGLSAGGWAREAG